MKNSLRSRWIWIAASLSFSAFAMAKEMPQQNPPPPQLRIETGRIGDVVFGGSARYRVLSVNSGLKDYKQEYNQDHKKLHPGFTSDRLAVVELEIENITEHPILPPVFMAALVESDGGRTTDWIMDAKQQSYLEESSRFGPRGSRVPAEIGVAQKMKVALIFSVSEKGKPTSLEFSPENFRDMPFGQPNRYRPGGGGPAGGQFGPRPGGPGQPPLPERRIIISLNSKGK